MKMLYYKQVFNNMLTFNFLQINLLITIKISVVFGKLIILLKNTPFTNAFYLKQVSQGCKRLFVISFKII